MFACRFRFLILYFFILSFASSCSYDFGNVPEGAQITCKSTTDCPSGYTCVDYTGRCVKSENLKVQPNVDGLVTLTPALLKNGATSVLTFDVNKDLAEPPVVIVKLAVDTAMIRDEKQSSGKHYVYTYTAKGGEPEGTNCPISFKLKDTYGLQSPVLSGGVLQFDFLVPDVSSSKMEGSPVKAGDKVTFTFNVNKALKTGKDPVVGFAGNSVGAVREQPVQSNFIKDPSSVPPKYIYTYTATGSEPQDTPQAVTVDLEDDAANTKNGILLDNIVFDFKKPTIKSQGITPEYVTRGGYVQLTFEASEELGKEPVVTVDGKPMYSAGKAGLVYTYSYQVIGGDSAGLKDTSITLVDRAGNESKDLIGPQANFDFTPPELETNPPPTVTPGMKMKGEVPFELSFTVTKPLTKDPDIVISNGEEKENITVTKKEQTGLTYVFSGTTPKTGTSPFYGITIKMTDLAGNFSAKPAGTIELDNVAPQVSTTTVGPDPAKLGVTIVYTVTPNEALLDKPQITVTNHADPTKTLAFSYNALQNVYTYTTTGRSNEVDGQYDVTVSMVDKAGNPATLSSETDPTIKPVNLVVSQPTVSGVSTNLAIFSKESGYNEMVLTFNCLKDVGAGLGVFLDLEDITNKCVWDGDEKKYKCTYDVSLTSQLEGAKSISITATDTAGNTSNRYTSVAFDFTKPDVLSATPGKPRYKQDETVYYTVNVSEALGTSGTPPKEKIVVNMFKNGSTTPDPTFFGDPTIKTDTSFTFVTVASAGKSGDYTVSIDLTDKAGNPKNGQAGSPFAIDFGPPVINLVSIETSNALQDAADPVVRAKAADVITAKFTVDKALQSNPLVTIGGNGMTYDSVSGTGPYTYKYTYPVTGAEGDGIKAVSVTATDLAGNISVKDIGNVTFDFTPPDYQTGSSVVQLISDFPRNPVVSIDSVTNNTTIAVTFNITEELYTNSRDPTKSSPDPKVVACKVEVCDPANSDHVIELDKDAGASIGRTYKFSKKLTGIGPELSFTAMVYTIPGTKGGMFDKAGNVQLQNLNIAQFKINTTQPNTPGVANVYYRRVPWGQNDANGKFVEKNFTVVCNACQFDTSVEKILIYDSATPSSGGLIGEFQNPHNGGAWSFDKITLNGSDRAHVWMAAADSAGNISLATEIKSAEWVATMGYKVPGSTIENPHAFSNIGMFRQTLIQEPYMTEPEIYSGTGIKQASEYGRQNWWNSTPREENSLPPLRYGHGLAYDSTRGKVVLFGGYDGSSYFNDTWEWDGVNWTPKAPVTRPSLRHNHALAFDSARGKTVLFGGGGYEGSTKFNDTWEWDGLNWTKKTTTTSPRARINHALAYDSARGKVVLFGGWNGSTNYNDTWEWDGSNWTQKVPAISPPVRYGHALAYDSTMGKVVLFGGYDGSTNYNDTWEWDGSNWTQKTTTASPPGRYGHALAYDRVRGKILIFGGRFYGKWGWVYSLFQDTWEWDGSNWTQKVPAISPPVRGRYDLAYDSLNGKIMLFGGLEQGNILNDLWNWDGMNWKQIFATVSPGTRYGHTLTYDSIRGKVVLFGGDDGRMQLNDTWEWDGVNWTQLFPATSPAVRENHSLAYDSMRGKTVLFGGMYGSTIYNDTWEWDGVNWTQIFPAASPPGRSYHSIAYDSARRKTVLFGGCGSDCNAVNNSQLNDTWEWDGVNWTQIFPTISPPIRESHSLAYDSGSGKVVLFGGHNNSDGLNDTWEWDGVNWAQKAPTISPPAASYYKLAYDSKRGKTVLFGVYKDSGGLNDIWEWNGINWTEKTLSFNPPERSYHKLAYDSGRGKTVLFGGSGYSGDLNDTWEWDEMSWTQKASTVSPSERHDHALAYDSMRGTTVLFGGMYGSTNYNDTWEWDGVDWTQKASVNSPSVRHDHALAYDSRRGMLVLFGGQDNSGRLHDTWEWDGAIWTQKSPATSPRGRNGHSLAYDSVRGKIVLFGGNGGGFNDNLQDTWEWDGVNWTQKTGAKPPSRLSHALTYDSMRGKTVLFGGSDANFNALNDTWEWDGIRWVQKNPATTPPAISSHALVYDSMRGKTVLFGGVIGSSNLNDTWEWDGQGNGRAGQVAGISIQSTGVFSDTSKPQVQQVAAKFVSGGSGYPWNEANKKVDKIYGVNLMAWYDNEWHPMASNTSSVATPGLVEWTTTDQVMIDKLYYGGGMKYNFAVVPIAPNGFGDPNCVNPATNHCDMGQVSTEYMEVMVKYTLP